jgi:CubicO group peptidase (beta-lactamase class C family)
MRPTRRLVLAGGAASSAMAAGGARAAAAVRASGREDLKPLIAEARRQISGAVHGAQIEAAAAALLVDGRVVWMEPFGVTGGAVSRTVDEHTIFSIQSTSKNCCATAIMLAVQRGLLDLDRPVSEYLPEFQVNSRLEDRPVPKMTLRRLLSHHAGLTHEAPVGNNYIADSPSFEAHVLSIQDTWLRYRVGERYSYSNLGIDLAGYILQRAAGKPYADCLREWLFEPLGMGDTTSAPEIYEANVNRAIGHSFGFDPVPVRLPLVASGGVYTSISDMTRYAQFHLGRGKIDGRRVLSQRLWEEMHSFRYSSDYALGVARFDVSRPGRKITLLNHNGGGFGFGCCFTHCPEEGVAWIVLFSGPTKAAPFPIFFDVMPEPLLAARYGPPTPTAAPAAARVTPPAELLQSREGLYMNGDARCDARAEDGALVLHFRGDAAPSRLAFTGDDDAWIEAGPKQPDPVRFHPANGVEPQTFEHPRGNHWDFIDGPRVPAGPVGSEYDALLGAYRMDVFGKPLVTVPISKRNGYLYLADIRLSPFQPGLLFSGQGEAVDFRRAVPTARNIRLTRV